MTSLWLATGIWTVTGEPVSPVIPDLVASGGSGGRIRHHGEISDLRSAKRHRILKQDDAAVLAVIGKFLKEILQ